MKAEIGLVLLGSALLLSGCDDRNLFSREPACRSFCDKLERCDDRTDLEGCLRACDKERTRSDAYLAARTACVEENSCNYWLGELGVMGEDVCSEGEDCRLNDCTTDALSPTGDEVAYCGKVVSKLNACDQQLTPSMLESNCLQLAPSLSTDYLREVQRCIDVDCGQVRSCLELVSDRFNTDISMYPNQSLEPRRGGGARLR